MSQAELRRLDGPEAVAAEAQELLTAGLWSRPSPAVCLPAGRTPLALFERLRAEPAALRASGALLFQLDEVVGAAPSEPRSFARLLREELLDPLDLHTGAFLLDGSAPDPEEEIRRHAAHLADAGGLDVAVLGLGTNGHVAFNEPGSRAEDRARVVELSPATRDALEGAPARGLTLGLAELLEAERVLLLVTGASKAAPLHRMLEEPRGPACPASWLREHPGLVVLADRAACSELSGY